MAQGEYQRCKEHGCRKKAGRYLYSTEYCAACYRTHYESGKWHEDKPNDSTWSCSVCDFHATVQWDGKRYCNPHYKEALDARYPKVKLGDMYRDQVNTEPDPLTDYTKVQPSPEPNYYLKQLIREVIAEELDKISAQKTDSNVDLIVEAIRSAMKGNNVS